jgi:excisionase family DNA binding protein
MLTVRRAAEILNVSPNLVYALCATGALEHERYGIGRGTIRISEQALAAFQARSRAVAAPPTLTSSRPTPVLKHLTLSPAATNSSSESGPERRASRRYRPSSYRGDPSGSLA